MCLEATLRQACRSRIEDTKSGQVLLSAAGNGSTVQFALPQGSSNLTPDAVASACSDLYDRYVDAKADLITAGTASPSDDQVLAEMLFRLSPRKTMADDFSGMRMR